MKNKTCCFTGHRKIPADEVAIIEKRTEEAVINLIGKGYRFFGTGGALGYDTVAATVVLKLKLIYPHIRLILVLPCRDQANLWSNRDREIYENIKRSADKIVYVSEKYTYDCMQKRNRHLVDHSAVCICYLKKSSGGTAYTVDYALKKGLFVFNVASYRRVS
ncbi:MAG: DUF1273 domain-containing protein [Anaerofustis stercorihominis]|nr:DUF1273 domain-containing protein [Anaerofustis stercorihominis]